MSVVERLSHSCGSKRGLNIFGNPDGTYSGFCFACSTYVTDPYKDKPDGYKPPAGFKKSAEEIEAEIKAINKFQTLALPDRKLKQETLEHFNVRVAVSEENGEDITAHYYPYTNDGSLVAYKVRIVKDKKFWSVGSVKNVDLFGWDEAIASGSKRLYITEGEIDAMSLYQIIKDNQKGEYADYGIAVVSLANGASSAAKELTKHAKSIREFFKEVVIVFDSDQPGKDAIEATLRIYPEAIVATLPCKDVNEGLLEGRSKAVMAACVWNAKKPKNTRLINAKDLFQAAKKKAEYGVSWPWKKLTEVTRGIRLGETIYIGAGQKQGKSEVVNTLAAHFITEHGWKVLLAKPEEANVKSVKMVAGKIAGSIFHDPKIAYDEDAYDEATEKIDENLILINLYQHVGWETLKADIREAAITEGCKAIFIDPITNLTNGMNAADANTKLQEIAQELAALALDLNVVIFIFCHLRNPDSGVPHERGGEVLSSQFAGSRAMARSCNLMLGIEGNRDPNLSKEERNIRTIVLLEDREYGETARMQLYWDDKTGLFNEI